MTHLVVLVAVGDESSKKSEKFEADNWSDIEEPPLEISYMRWYVAVFYAGNHYYFGGTALSSILCLNGSSLSWSNAGQLNSSRNGHGVILVGNTFTIVGGEGTLRNEACLLSNGQFNCTELSTSLTNYS